MYCKICGLEQPEAVNYCTHDGSSTDSIDSHVMLVPQSSKYCRTCGQESKEYATYCEKCGDSLLGVAQKESNMKLPNAGAQLHVNASGSMLKKGLFGGAFAIVCMFIAGFIGSLIIDSAINDVVETAVRNTDGMLNMNTINQSFIGIAPLILMCHLIGIEISGSGAYTMSFLLHIPLFILVTIPALILGGSGFFVERKKPSISWREKFMTSCVIGMIYGIFLCIVSFMASSSTSISYFYQTMTIDVVYSHVVSLLFGIIFGLLFSFIGMSIEAGPHRMLSSTSQFVPYVTSIYYSIVTVLKGLLITFGIILITILFSSSKSMGPIDFPEKAYKVLLSLEATPFMWNMAHLSSTEIEWGNMEREMHRYSVEKGPLHVSYMSGISIQGTSLKDLEIANGASADRIKDIDDFNSYLHWWGLLILLPCILLVRAGMKLAQYRMRNMYVTIAVFSAVYTVMMLCVNGLAKIHITASGSKEIMKEFAGISGPILSIQSNTLYLIVGSFLISYVLTFAGMKLVKK
ncbi:zinc ribbon domain-containing protein [Bacillus cereus group sp. N34]|uniref:zinc ribbon domain-containing protein n=1 Tax=Bacillus cereus group sp. N34 TaxID=2794595 RepID=UPI0018F5F89B|nr:zinc ribbon domain-containing protein [Bacillus cereus group sp. N34]MBJ8016972.1 zinc ribbon domain-containing protein [Bacillus cereus group sp. N34]